MERDLLTKFLALTSLDSLKLLNKKSIASTLTKSEGDVSDMKELQNKPKRKPLSLTISSGRLAGHQNGIDKICQDEILISSLQTEESQAVLLSIFDGHGPDGHLVAQLGRSVLPGIFEKMMNDKATTQTKLSKGIERVFNELDELVKSQGDIVNVEMSGSTLVTVLIVAGRVYCAWVGDSRAMVAYQIEGVYSYQSLSVDHLPGLEIERNRILASGGIIHPSKDAAGNFYGPKRVWNPKYSERPAPGLMMSRSIGDFAGKEVGVSCKPDVVKRECSSSLKFLILASDGLWEVMSEAEVGEIVYPFLASETPSECARVVIEHANARWSRNSPIYRDDISVIIVFF